MGTGPNWSTTVQSPAFQSAYNTLGIVYLRRGELALAERAFRHVLRPFRQRGS